ncbi:MAG: hypothetical protein Hyperionvirus2_71 [Hyperionvirus sp.]|uniref:Uncharacterized protein n=1 Tax=Hyperionvirus sp. TaxID=2487770 RepID=A0A3G5AA24_9VIRU|nr:MAG: hypothetical protein Hyperionvirus2_71 [Hyperionvirus sp.]
MRRSVGELLYIIKVMGKNKCDVSNSSADEICVLKKEIRSLRDLPYGQFSVSYPADGVPQDTTDLIFASQGIGTKILIGTDDTSLLVSKSMTFNLYYNLVVINATPDPTVNLAYTVRIVVNGVQVALSLDVLSGAQQRVRLTSAQLIPIPLIENIGTISITLRVVRSSGNNPQEISLDPASYTDLFVVNARPVS